MKVFVIGSRGFPNALGGIEKHCEELYSRLSEYPEMDIYVFAMKKYTPNKHKTWHQIKFIYIDSINIKGIEKLYYGIKSTILAIFMRPDIVHYQGLNCAIYIPLARLFGLKVVYTQHSMDYNYPTWSRFAKYVLRMSEKSALYANQLISVSTSIYKHLKQYTNNVVIIKNGVSFQTETPSTKVTQFILNIYHIKADHYILFVGRFTKEKAIEDLLNAYAGMDISYKLVIVGDVDHNNSYSRMIKQKIMETPNVIWTGFIYGETLQVILMNTHMFILPSKFEGTPLVLLEAMSYGVKILASNISSNRQIRLENECYFRQGNVEDLRQKMSYLLNRKQDEKIKNSRINILKQEYNWDIITKKHYEIYKKVVNL